MAQFGGQKNPPWAAQFAATAVSQPGHSAQSLDLNSLHCEWHKWFVFFITSNLFTCSVINPCGFNVYWFEPCFFHCPASLCEQTWKLQMNLFCALSCYSLRCSAAVSFRCFPLHVLPAVSLGCSIPQHTVCCQLPDFPADCGSPTAGSRGCRRSTATGELV